jgi:hypothetical protein
MNGRPFAFLIKILPRLPLAHLAHLAAAQIQRTTEAAKRAKFADPQQRR